MDENPYSEVERENAEAAFASREKEPDEDYSDETIPEDDIEPSEETIALASLDAEHYQDYLAIKRAVERTDLAERLVDMAVKSGLARR